MPTTAVAVPHAEPGACEWCGENPQHARVHDPSSPLGDSLVCYPCAWDSGHDMKPYPLAGHDGGWREGCARCQRSGVVALAVRS